MFCRFFLTCSLIILLMACVPAASTLLPTVEHTPYTTMPSPSPLSKPSISSPTIELITPTVIKASPTPESIPDPTPTETPPPLLTLDLPRVQTETVVPQPSADSGAIQIFSPGPLSKVVSPVRVYGYAVAGYNNKGRLNLYGEDGRLLESELLQLNTPYNWAYFYLELPFNTHTVGELGRLTLSTQDEYGRDNAINSVHLLLLSEGQSIINPPGNLMERCVIELPLAGQRISGGVLTVSGKIRPYNNLPLTVELVTRDGNIIGVQLAAISPALNDVYVPFRVDIPYSIPGNAWALLVVRQNDDRIGGIMYLYSREIFLYP
jgi:hypothetical protein